MASNTSTQQSQEDQRLKIRHTTSSTVSKTLQTLLPQLPPHLHNDCATFTRSLSPTLEAHSPSMERQSIPDSCLSSLTLSPIINYGDTVEEDFDGRSAPMPAAARCSAAHCARAPAIMARRGECEQRTKASLLCVKPSAAVLTLVHVI